MESGMNFIYQMVSTTGIGIGFAIPPLLNFFLTLFLFLTILFVFIYGFKKFTKL